MICNRRGVTRFAGLDLGIREDPPHLLIGPDGKLIKNVTKIEELKQEIEKAIGKTAR